MENIESSNENIIGKKSWGPYAWHLLHTFSINNNRKIKSHEEKTNYYMFYKTFGYIIPCFVCREHYKDEISFLHPLIEEDITRKYIIKWVFTLHNRVNKRLKKQRFSYSNCVSQNIIPQNGKIFFFIDIVLKNINYKTIDVYQFEQIHNFFITFSKLYPDLHIRKKLVELINTKQFTSIVTPTDFYKWYIKNNRKCREMFFQTSN